MLSVCVNEWVSAGVLSGMECTLKPSYLNGSPVCQSQSTLPLSPAARKSKVAFCTGKLPRSPWWGFFPALTLTKLVTSWLRDLFTFPHSGEQWPAVPPWEVGYKHWDKEPRCARLFLGPQWPPPWLLVSVGALGCSPRSPGPHGSNHQL